MIKNKYIAIGIIVFVLIVGAIFIMKEKEVIDVSLFGEDESELKALGNDIDLFGQEAALLNEVDQAFGDLLDEGVAISAEEALDENVIGQEANEADQSQTLDAFASDEVILGELDQIFGEVSQ